MVGESCWFKPHSHPKKLHNLEVEEGKNLKRPDSKFSESAHNAPENIIS